jgi:hypothetical protein
MSRYAFLSYSENRTSERQSAIQNPIRNISIVNVVDETDEHGAAGRYSSAIQSRTNVGASDLSLKLEAGSSYVKKMIEEKLLSKRKNDLIASVPNPHHSESKDPDVEMGTGDFFINRRKSPEFKQLVWNALNADWMMDLDQFTQNEDDSVIDHDDVFVS